MLSDLPEENRETSSWYFAMNCAAAIGGRANINRYGHNVFGNGAVIEKHTCLSGRDNKEDEESEEAEE